MDRSSKKQQQWKRPNVLRQLWYVLLRLLQGPNVGFRRSPASPALITYFSISDIFLCSLPVWLKSPPTVISGLYRSGADRLGLGLDTICVVIPGITICIAAISPTENFKVRNKPYQLHTNYITKSSLQILYKYVAIFHEYIHYITKYNILSTLGNCLHASGMFQMTHNAPTCKTIIK